MPILNIEIKARCNTPDQVRKILEQQNARFIGTDHQIDTYFKVDKGRLKLREGNIENSLIHYDRPNQSGPKASEVALYRSKEGAALKEVLSKVLDTWKIVDKQRSIYFIDNVKFHVDEVQTLGSFVEIEAIDKDGSIGKKKLLQQCEHFMSLLGIKEEDLLDCSYSDMVENL